LKRSLCPNLIFVWKQRMKRTRHRSAGIEYASPYILQMIASNISLRKCHDRAKLVVSCFTGVAITISRATMSVDGILARRSSEQRQSNDGGSVIFFSRPLHRLMRRAGHAARSTLTASAGFAVIRSWGLCDPPTRRHAQVSRPVSQTRAQPCHPLQRYHRTNLLA